MQAKSWRLGRKIVGFDLDDTLIPRERAFATEELGFWRRSLIREQPRKDGFG
jgi:hypothetical protein